MAEYTRGLDNREEEYSGRNNNEDGNTRRRTWGVDLNAVNYEQRRAPYGSSRNEEQDMYDQTGNNNSPGNQREDV